MSIYEFFIRLSMINGHKLSKIKNFSKFPLEITIDSSINLLKQLGFNEIQMNQFKNADNTKIASTLKWLDKPNHYLISYFNRRYPPLLRTISSAPLILFVKGEPHLLKTPQIAMVGSRKFSEYGGYFANYFTKHLVNNLVITSGLALGIDSICHQAALTYKGKTVAVLGSGIEKIYPTIHHKLADHIIYHGGALVSEFLPGETAKPAHFPRRNRIISGLCLATFIIEASKKSGSLITANYALEQNRTIFVLPGDIRNKNYYGNHQLIKQGAFLVTEAEDIFSVLDNSTLRKFTQPLNPPITN